MKDKEYFIYNLILHSLPCAKGGAEERGGGIVYFAFIFYQTALGLY